jgi:FAD:protein FMN transferase
MWKRRLHELRLQREPILGTLLTVYAAAKESALAHTESVLLGEIARLETIFSAYNPDSELRRWQKTGSSFAPGRELIAMLEEARVWQVRTGGIFNPAVGVLTARWKRAAVEQVEPSSDELFDLANQIAEPTYDVVGEALHKVGDCSSLNFNAFAKGRVVDLAARKSFYELELTTLLVNIGGDLVHLGDKGALVEIEDPHRPFDNTEPLASTELRNAGFATSGSARRGFTIGGQWFSHVIDPRSGQPVDRVASASVKAVDAATADVLATMASVEDPTVALPFVEAHAAVGFVVTNDRRQHRSAGWLDDHPVERF